MRKLREDLARSLKAPRRPQVHESQLVERQHVGNGHNNLQGSHKCWVWKVVDTENCLVEESDRDTHHSVSYAS